MQTKEHPILFSTKMARAILEGRKTQTRRVMKPQPEFKKKEIRPTMDEPDDVFLWNEPNKGGTWFAWGKWDFHFDLSIGNKCPYGQVGDRLWVRETWALDLKGVEPDGFERLLRYKADNQTIVIPESQYDWFDKLEDKERYAYLWRPSIFMPRWASRITLEITETRVQKLQEISEKDAILEGCPKPTEPPYYAFTRWVYQELWDSINGKKYFSWASNPWVWVISFKRLSTKNASL